MQATTPRSLGFDFAHPERPPADGAAPSAANAEAPDAGEDPRIERHLAARERALDAYRALFAALETTERAAEAAHAALSEAAPTHQGHHTDTAQSHGGSQLYRVEHLPEEAFLAAATTVVDHAIWLHIERSAPSFALIDTRTRRELAQRLHDGPPAINRKSLAERLHSLDHGAERVIQRSAAHAFSALDPRFRSPGTFPARGRIVIEHALYDSGMWSYSSAHREAIADAEQVLRALDGAPARSASIVDLTASAMDEKGYGCHAVEVSTDHVRLRAFKNTNVHLWFPRADLMERVDALLRAHYGPHHPPNEPDAALPTPEPLARELAQSAGLHAPQEEAPALRTLVPCEGDDTLARHIAREYPVQVDCTEPDARRAARMRDNPRLHDVRACRLLDLDPARERAYERIVMHPPLARGNDIMHLRAALALLAPGGMLTALVHNATRYGESPGARALREDIAAHRHRWRDLPEDSLAAAGSRANATILSLTRR